MIVSGSFVLTIKTDLNSNIFMVKIKKSYLLQLYVLIPVYKKLIYESLAFRDLREYSSTYFSLELYCIYISVYH